MKNIVDYRMVIISHDGKICEYPLISSGMHQECLDKFAKDYGYEYSSPVYLAKSGNAIFYNSGNKMFGGYFPGELSNEQLYMLDYLENWLADVEYLNIYKYVEQGCEEYLFLDNVQERFSDEFIQSYYKVDKSGIKKK